KQMGEMKGKLSYPRRGMGELPRGLASAFASQGGSVEVNSEVTKIEVDGDRVSGMTYVEDGEKKDMETSTVVSTIPFKDLPNIVDLPREYRDRLKKIEYTEFIIAYFGLDSRITEQDFMVLVPKKEGLSLTSFVEVSNISKDLAPNGKSLFAATGTSYTVSETNDEKVLGLFIEDLNSLFPGFEEKINWKKLIRMPYVAITKEYPLMKLDFTSSIRGLYITGSQMFPIPGMPEAIVSGHTVSGLITQNLSS
ncbi:MAG: FAD-dependent oxidoreductase, partial [Thermodesulfobacteriota bacterium]